MKYKTFERSRPKLNYYIFIKKKKKKIEGKEII